jgi:site-specific recombinase XerD
MNALQTFFKLMKPEATPMGSFYRMKVPKHLPVVLSRAEVEKLIAAAANLKHKVILMLLYSCGLRLSECISLKPVHIESGHMKVRVEQGKGNKDRYTILPHRTLLTLREYFRAFKPNVWLIEGKGAKQYGRRTVGKVVANAARKAGINKKVTPHTLRHYAEFRIMPSTIPCHLCPLSSPI